MNVLHIISGDIWAGAEVQACSLIRGCARIVSCKVQVIILNDGVLATKLREAHIPVTILNEHELSLISLVSGCLQVIKAFNPQIVHMHGFKENLLGGIAGRLARVKGLIRTHHGRGLIGGAKKYDMIEHVNAWLFTDIAIAVSHDLKKLLIEFGIPEKKVVVIHNGIEPCKQLTEERIKTLRMELRIAKDDKVIGTIGRMVPIKDHRTFINSAKLIIDSGIKARFVIVGDGHLREELEQQVRDLSLDHHFCFTGFREDANDLLNLFDVFAMTSVHEGVPIALLEAMSLGKPVVATSVGGVPEVLKDHVSGMLVPSGDANLFADACLSMLQNEALRKALSEHAYREIQEEYSLNTMVKKIQDEYWRAAVL